jgi:uncharacterized SAM-binding protein YcdF (DUF218 family)
MKLTRKRALLVFLLLFVCWLALYVARPLYLPFLGEFLISADPLEKADAIIVLAGDDAVGSRVAEAVSLVREGWSQVLMVSDAPIAWGVTSGELARQQAVALGISPTQIVAVSNRSPAGLGFRQDTAAQRAAGHCHSGIVKERTRIALVREDQPN